MPEFPPDPPPGLPALPSAFYVEFREMLARVAPSQLDPERSRVNFDSEGVNLTLAHRRQSDWEIWAEIGDGDGVVGAGEAHQHFGLGGAGDDDAWPSAAVDFIAELLRGDIQIETTYRGDDVIAVRHAFAGGSVLGQTYPLTLARLKLWRKKRTSTETISFAE